MPLINALNSTMELGLSGLASRAAGLALLWYVASSVAAWHKLRHVPGPFFATFSYIWCFWTTYSGRSERRLTEGEEKYGEIMRVGPDAVAITDPDEIMRINSARSPYVRGYWYGAARIDPTGDSVISELDLASHGKRKAKLATAFSGKNLAFLERKVDFWIGQLVGAIRDRVKKGEEIIDLSKITQYFQVDLISEIQIGRAWGDLAADEDHFGYVKMSENVVPAVQAFAFLPLARMFVTSEWFMRNFGPKPTDSSGLGLFMGIIAKEVKKRFENADAKHKESEDVLDEWVKHGVTPRQCELDLSLLIPAGSETSVMMVRGTLLLLMTSPAVYQRAKQEIREALAAGRISSPVTNEEAKSLPYMQAITREGMRLMAPINFGFPKRVPASGDIVCGKFLPAGTDVYPSSNRMMRRKDVFGDDVDTFRPERFLGNGPDIVHMSKVVDSIFGGGRFMCLGKVLAQLEINKIFIELLRNFDFQVAKPEKPWVRTVYTTSIIHNYWVRATEDTTMPSY